MTELSRRRLLASSGLTLAAGLTPALPAFAGADERRLLVVILRGGMDGLAALPPLGDPDFAGLRTAGAAPLPLDGFFGLHPALPTLARLWARKEMIGFHAVGTPYRERSHFDAQNVLESGLDGPSGSADGWLNRAVAERGAPAGYAMGWCCAAG
jgi:uncharacterized protein (DUF1501 family)